MVPKAASVYTCPSFFPFSNDIYFFSKSKTSGQECLRCTQKVWLSDHITMLSQPPAGTHHGSNASVAPAQHICTSCRMGTEQCRSASKVLQCVKGSECIMHCTVLMHSLAQMDAIVSLAQLQDVDSRTSTVCAVQCHHTRCPQVVIKIKPQRIALLCCNAFQVKILFSSMTIKSGLLRNETEWWQNCVSAIASLLRDKSGKHDCDRSSRRTRSEGTTKARRILSLLSPHSRSERSQIFTLNIFLWFLVAFL